MDSASHALVGLTLYHTHKPRYFYHNPAVFWAALIGSEMPDLDIVYQLDGNLAYLLNHRGITHSLPGVLCLAAVLAYILHYRYTATPFRSLFAWSSAAGIVHIMLDAANTWGTRIWFPFSSIWVTWDILPFFDPLLIFLCGASILAGFLKPQNRRHYAVVALLLFSLYAGGRCILHHQLVHELRLQYLSASTQKISVLPTMHPLRWQAVIETKTSVMLGNINTSSRQLTCTAWYPTYEDPLLTSCRSNAVIARSLPFFRYPALSFKQEAGKNVIVVSDLYFNANTNRCAAFELSNDGFIERQRRTPARLTWPMLQ